MLSRLKEAGDWLPSHHHGGTETLPSSTSSPSTLRSMTPPPRTISFRPTFHPCHALSSTDVQRSHPVSKVKSTNLFGDLLMCLRNHNVINVNY
ncbi:hypothetical protein HanRHA438_Chr15g0711571 [Helianthus annuus]|nr:hypothetical protein HanRHA438_Chr15g0711571 [Helianthus annuus]